MSLTSLHGNSSKWNSRLLLTSSAVSLVALAAITLQAPPASAATDVRVDLKILVLDDGDVNVGAIKSQLDKEGVPYTALSLADSGRAAVTDAYLSDVVGDMPRAKFQGVVMPSSAAPGVTADENAAIDRYQTQFGTRVVSAYNYANPAIGLDAPSYSGGLDGSVATVTPNGLTGPFQYLRGSFPFEDNSPTVTESYGFLSSPTAAPAAGTSFTSLLTAKSPDKTKEGVLAGVYTDSGREDMVITFAYNRYQRQFGLIAPGIVEWLTRGVHLGLDRKYFTVHVDDVLNADGRWSTTGNCTPGEDCAAGVTTTDILMTPDDVRKAVAWQKANNFKLNMVYNAGPAVDRKTENGSDPLTTTLLQNAKEFPWINHTYEHTYLGCIQVVTTIPWKCATNARGQILYTSRAEIESQIRLNAQWGVTNRLPMNRAELVTGEHSGLKYLPQMPLDNPNLAAALSSQGITVTGSDNSRDPLQRKIGNTSTLPRYPMNLYFNVAKAAEMTDEYNWVYTSKANGGGGNCEINPLSTCITPLTAGTGYKDVIVPQEAQIDMTHILNNDPRPHYVHQSNLAEDRLLYPMLEKILGDYRAWFADNTPLVNPTMTEAGRELTRAAAWNTVKNTTTAYVVGNVVKIESAKTIDVPLTLPAGSTFGTAYSGVKSAWLNVLPPSATQVASVTPYGPVTPAPGTPAPAGLAAATPGTILPLRFIP